MQTSAWHSIQNEHPCLFWFCSFDVHDRASSSTYDRQPKIIGNFFSIFEAIPLWNTRFSVLVDAVYGILHGKFIPFPKEIIGIWDH